MCALQDVLQAGPGQEGSYGFASMAEFERWIKSGSFKVLPEDSQLKATAEAQSCMVEVAPLSSHSIAPPTSNQQAA